MGNFKCTSTNGSDCQMYSLGRTSTGDFTYDYQPNSKLLSAAGISNQTTVKLRMLQARTNTTSTTAVATVTRL